MADNKIDDKKESAQAKTDSALAAERDDAKKVADKKESARTEEPNIHAPPGAAGSVYPNGSDYVPPDKY